jgi:hypothetical protein
MTQQDLYVALTALAVVAVPLALAWLLLCRGDSRQHEDDRRRP